MNIQVACTFAILHRNKPWVSYWLKRYVKEGVEGLKDKPKSGRPSQLPKEIVLNIGKKLSESKRGWSTKQVNDIIVKEGGGGVQYHYTPVCRLPHKWGGLNKRCQGRYILILQLNKRKCGSKKSEGNYVFSLGLSEII